MIETCDLVTDYALRRKHVQLARKRQISCREWRGTISNARRLSRSRTVRCVGEGQRQMIGNSTAIIAPMHASMTQESQDVICLLDLGKNS